MPKKGTPSLRDRELIALLSIEDNIRRLRQYHSRPNQRWDFLEEPLSKINAERVTLQMAMAGNKESIRLRGRKSNANDSVGQ